MAATGTAAVAATGRLLILLLLGLTAPAAALAGYIEVRTRERSSAVPSALRGSAARERGTGGRAGAAAAGQARPPPPAPLGAVLGAGGRRAARAAEAT